LAALMLKLTGLITWLQAAMFVVHSDLHKRNW